MFLIKICIKECNLILSFINSLKVKNPYEQCIRYDSIKSGIQTHAETYSFNIDSKLFPQLTKEQQELWRKEIEQAVISGGDAGVELAKDIRYKENLEVKKVNLDNELDFVKDAYYYFTSDERSSMKKVAKHFFELGLKTQKEENNLENLFQALPEKIADEKSHQVYELSIYHYDSQCVVDYVGEIDHDSLYAFSGNTLYEAIEKAWNWLRENAKGE